MSGLNVNFSTTDIASSARAHANVSTDGTVNVKNSSMEIVGEQAAGQGTELLAEEPVNLLLEDPASKPRRFEIVLVKNIIKSVREMNMT